MLRLLFCPYSLECVEGVFREVGFPLAEVLRTPDGWEARVKGASLPLVGLSCSAFLASRVASASPTPRPPRAGSPSGGSWLARRPLPPRRTPRWPSRTPRSSSRGWPPHHARLRQDLLRRPRSCRRPC